MPFGLGEAVGEFGERRSVDPLSGFDGGVREMSVDLLSVVDRAFNVVC